MIHFVFRQMNSEDIPVYMNDIFAILASNMRAIAPTGDSYEEDFEIWSRYTVPAWLEGKNSVILILHEDILCGYFQYSVDDTTFRMEDIQFKKEYQGCGLFTELYRYLTTIIPIQTKYVDAFADKRNIKSQEILKHLGLTVIGENKNGRSFHFKGEYKNLLKLYPAV